MPRNISNHDSMVPRTTLECPHEGPRVVDPGLFKSQFPIVSRRIQHLAKGAPLARGGMCGPISPYSGRDCVKSLRSSYTGLYPRSAGVWPCAPPPPPLIPNFSNSIFKRSSTKGPRFYLTQSVYKVSLQSQFPHKSVNVPFIITNIKNRLTDFCRS